MRLGRFLVVAAMALSFAMPAKASTVSDLGTLVAGDFGDIGVDNIGFSLISSLTGSLSSNSMLTMTYSYVSSGNELSVSSAADVANGYGAASSSYTYLPSISVFSNSYTGAILSVLTTVDGSSNLVTTVIKNLSASAAVFASAVTAILDGADYMDVHYEVSSVPLPAALPLFALGLAGLAGVGYRRRKESDAV